MLHRTPKSGFSANWKSGAKTLLIAEGFLALGSYAIWSCMNRSQNCRYYMRNNFPYILEGYYTVCEKLSGENDMRVADLLLWEDRRNEH